jgi:hypothetical protein
MLQVVAGVPFVTKQHLVQPLRAILRMMEAASPRILVE